MNGKNKVNTILSILGFKLVMYTLSYLRVFNSAVKNEKSNGIGKTCKIC